MNIDITAYEVKDHFLYYKGKQVKYVPTPNRSDLSKAPTVGINHDTAGHLRKGSSVSWLTNKKARASSHLVTERDGTIVQLAPFNIATWHAGKSSYKGVSGVNKFSIGNEIVNPGQLIKVGENKYRSWFKTIYIDDDNDPNSNVRYGKIENGRYSFEGYWLDYTPEQIAAVTGSWIAIFEAYPSMQALETHWKVSPGRKVDTGPLFPLDAIRARVFGRNGEEIKNSDSEETTKLKSKAKVYVRQWPSFYDSNILGFIEANTELEFIKEGTFRREGNCVICDKLDDGWTKIRLSSGIEGWIVSEYIERI